MTDPTTRKTTRGRGMTKGGDVTKGRDMLTTTTGREAMNILQKNFGPFSTI